MLASYIALPYSLGPEPRYAGHKSQCARWMTGGPHGHRRGRGRPAGPPWARGAFPFGGPGGPWGREHRAERGDVRGGILALLNEEPMHGYQVMRELAQRSGGAWRPSPGSVYPTLAQLEDEGLIVPVQSEGGKRVFELTDAGREQVKATAGVAAPWEAAAAGVDDELVELRDLAFQVGAAVMQVAAAGGPGHVGKARQILKDARRSLYRLLAEDEEDGEVAEDAQDPAG